MSGLHRMHKHLCIDINYQVSLNCYLLQVIDEYDEQSEVAERLRIKVTISACTTFLYLVVLGIKD